MTTKVVDSTVSQFLQDDSSVEYVDSHENSIATIPRDDASVQDVEDPRSLELIFGQKHNDIECALCPTAKRACNRAWVTAKQIENWSKMSTMTLSRRLHELEDCERITSLSDLVKTYVPDSLGVLHETTLYNLNVLNQLAMVEMKNKVLNETSKKFSDILSEVETTGSYGVAQPELTDAEIMSRALEIAHRTLALREERIKALTAERDEAIRTKYHFVEGRDAKVCGELGGLRTQNEALRKQIGDSKTYKAATAISWLPDYFDMSNRGLYGSLAAKLKKVEAEMPPAFAHIDIQDSRWGSVKAYHVAVIERLHEMVQADESLMKKYRKIASV